MHMTTRLQYASSNNEDIIACNRGEITEIIETGHSKTLIERRNKPFSETNYFYFTAPVKLVKSYI